jgi:hypothetical protein
MVRLFLHIVGTAFNLIRIWKEHQSSRWLREFFALVKRRDQSPTTVGFTYRPDGTPHGLVHAIGETDRIGLSG